MAAVLPEAGMVALCVAIGKAMAVELPEAGTVALCLTVGKAMAAVLPEAGLVALCVAIAFGCREMLKLLLHFLEGSPSRGPALDAAAIVVVLNVVMAFVSGVVQLYLVTLEADISVVLALFRQFVLFVYVLPLALLLLFVFVAAVFHLLPAAGGNTPN